jgi:uncharacterized membrane protein YoaK (UPF0700 family)
VPSRFRVLLLTFAAGCVDAIVFLMVFSLFTAHLSGDTTRLAIDLGHAHFGTDALARVTVLALFMVGVVVGVAAVAANTRHRRALPPVEIACLVTVLALGSATRDAGDLRYGHTVFYVLIAAAAFAMGLQNAYVRRAAGVPVHTTFITGMLTSLAEDAVMVFRDRADAAARGRIALYGSLWLSYLAGGVVGAALALEAELDFWSLVLPIALLAIVWADELFVSAPSYSSPRDAPRRSR